MFRKLFVLVFGAAFLLGAGVGCKDSKSIGPEIKDASNAPKLKQMTPGTGGGKATPTPE
jgi:hypothetical protein